MNFLATTPIKSHGRLKASNCVVDNRWTLKITGTCTHTHTHTYTLVNVNTIKRYLQYVCMYRHNSSLDLDYGMHLFKAEQRGVSKFNPVLGRQTTVEEGIENSVKASLLYTAPEILRTGVTHPDHVGAGSLHGDMYSMAMIMVEILTHESPFNEYLDYVDVDDILQAIAGQKNINSQLPPVKNTHTHTCTHTHTHTHVHTHTTHTHIHTHTCTHTTCTHVHVCMSQVLLHCLFVV